jgi:hypothetical protein
MALSHNPSTITKNLVFSFDVNNLKSYKGPVVANILKQLSNNNSTAAGISITAGTEEVFIPQLGKMTSKYSLIQNNYPAVSTNCCPSPFTFGNGFTVLPSTLYTYAIVYKVESGYTNSNYMYRYEYTSLGGSKTIEGGVFNNTRRVHLGNGWYWAWGTFTTQATSTWIGYTGFFYYRYSTVPDRAYVAKAILVQGDYSSLHPKLWPELNTTRSITQTLYDLTGTNEITPNSVTYNSDGTFTFVNTNTNEISLPNSLGYNTNNISAFAWFKRNGSPSGSYQIICGGQELEISIPDPGGQLRVGIVSGGTRYVSNHGSGLLDGNWHYIGFTSDGTTKTAYIDGVAVGTQAVLGSLTKTFANRKIGRFGSSETYYTNGDIPAYYIYNRALTAAEIRQNYNALKGRYGL